VAPKGIACMRVLPSTHKQYKNNISYIQGQRITKVYYKKKRKATTATASTKNKYTEPKYKKVIDGMTKRIYRFEIL